MLSSGMVRSYNYNHHLDEPSGGEYDSHLSADGTSTSDGDESGDIIGVGFQQSAGESAQQRIARRKQKRKRKRSSANNNNLSSASLWTKAGRGRSLGLFLLAGLVFCLLDVLYMLNLVADERHSLHNNSIISSIRSSFSSTNLSILRNVDIPDEAVSNWKERRIQHIPSDWPETEIGKEPILRLLQEATGADEIDADLLDRIPTVQQVTALYGRDPVVLGLETCHRFQTTGDPAEHLVSTAGSFNTGTNLMAELLIANCHMPAHMVKYGKTSRGVRWQVLWGKHTPVFDEAFRQQHRTYNDSFLTANNMFPAVMVRDPFKWAQSMCRHPYGAQWPHDPEHCPNLVPNDVDRQLLRSNPTNWGALAEHGRAATSVNVTVQYAAFDQHHDSLLEFWNDWYRDYVKAPFPRLIVRFEDVVFHPKLITQIVCECAGGEMNRNKPFKYIVESAKKGTAHGAEGQKTSYVDALIKYGTEQGRYKGFEAADLEYAVQHLNPDLMRLLGYKFPVAEAEGAAAAATT